ncbi:MAG: hypothetical protein RLY86_2746 [Pseudomonadota bacterium]|jgi:Ca2+-binding RTX toxin-like protein
MTTQTITGGTGADTLAGTTDAEVINANAGNDTVTAGAGHDTINGGAGADQIDGQDGDDLIQGGADADVIRGGAGNDTLTGRGQNDTFAFGPSDTGFDAVDGGAGNDTILALAEGTVIGLRSAAGVETVSANGFANVVVRGDGGNNSLNFTNAILTGITLIDGGAGNDSITGGSSADQIRGGARNDTLSGGAGADIFRFFAAADSTRTARDVITDFDPVRGDRIDLSAIDARSDLPGDQTFTFGGFSAAPQRGQVTYVVFGGGTGALVVGDVNGDGVIDFQIELIAVNGPLTLTAADFIL